jgi:hypothetical protein
LEQHPGEEAPRRRRVLERAAAAFLVNQNRRQTEWVGSPGLDQPNEPGKRREGRLRVHLVLEGRDLRVEKERLARLGTAIRENAGAGRAGQKASGHQNRCVLGGPGGSPFRENTFGLEPVGMDREPGEAVTLVAATVLSAILPR